MKRKGKEEGEGGEGGKENGKRGIFLCVVAPGSVSFPSFSKHFYL